MTGLNDESVRWLVLEVVRRVAARLGADGSRGSIALALTGATSGFTAVVALLRGLVLDGFRLELAFSPAARSLYGEAVLEALAGWPHVSEVDEGRWLSALKNARLVAAPLLSVNTLSKLALLVADTLPGNLLLHALFMGKPVVAAVDGVHPDDRDRRRLGFASGNAELRRAVRDRLETVARYGCVLSDLRSLRGRILQAVEAGAPEPTLAGGMSPVFGEMTRGRGRRVITASDVRLLSASSGVLTIPAGSLLTPLAREVAERRGVRLQVLDSPSNREGWP